VDRRWVRTHEQEEGTVFFNAAEASSKEVELKAMYLPVSDADVLLYRLGLSTLTEMHTNCREGQRVSRGHRVHPSSWHRSEYAINAYCVWNDSFGHRCAGWTRRVLRVLRSDRGIPVG